jgi:dGTP triphosphohydrolase
MAIFNKRRRKPAKTAKTLKMNSKSRKFRRNEEYEEYSEYETCVTPLFEDIIEIFEEYAEYGGYENNAEEGGVEQAAYEASDDELAATIEDIKECIEFLEMASEVLCEELGYEPTEEDVDVNMDTEELVDPDYEKEDEDETVDTLETMRKRRRSRRYNRRSLVANKKKAMTNAEWLALAPDKKGVEAYLTVQKKEKAYKDSLIATILTNSKAGWIQGELKPMNMTQLERIVDGMGAELPPDYGIRGMQMAANKEAGVELQIDAFAPRNKNKQMSKEAK